MLKRFLSVLLCFCLIVSCTPPVYAHGRDEHDEEIELVLFGSTNYKQTHPEVSDIVEALEDATYLAVDQFNGNGADALARLQKRHIPDLPKKIEDFDFNSNFAHRNFTHRGWNVQYDAKAHWPLRQQILTSTVRKELFSSVETPLGRIPWLSEKVFADQEKDIARQCESFCVLLYYIHILGDHLEAERNTALAYVCPLTRPEDRDNPGVIPDLLAYFPILFASQKNTHTYSLFIQELESINARSDSLVQSEGGINTDEEFSAYHKCAEDLRDLLADYLPSLLKKEPFFRNTFYNT